MTNLIYVWAKKALPLSVKRFIVLSLRRLKASTVSSTTRSTPSRNINYDLANSDVPKTKRAPISNTNPFAEFVPKSRSAPAKSTDSRCNQAPIGALLKSQIPIVDIIELEDLPEVSGPKILIFIETAAAKFNYADLSNKISCGRYFVLFRAKKDYLDFLDIVGNLCDDSEWVNSKISYIPTIDPSLDESVYNKADDLSKKFVNSVCSSLSTSTRYEYFSRFIQSVEVGVSDRFAGWIRSYEFILKFIVQHNINEFYLFGNRLVDNNLMAFSVSRFCSIPCGLIRLWSSRAFKSICRATINDVVSRDWVVSSRTTTTRYNISKYCNAGDEVFLFFGNLRDPMYRETLRPVLDGFSRKTDRKILVLLPYADEYECGSNCEISGFNYVLPSVEKDDVSDIDEFNTLFDLGIDHFLSSKFSGGLRKGLLALYVVMNSRKAVHRLLRDCYGLMKEVDEVVTKSKISALVSNPGRLWPSQFLVGYLNYVPSFDIQSGTFSRSSRFKKPGSEHVLAIDDFSKSVYVDYLGVNPLNVEVVGAPRIDARLTDIRKFTQEESCKEISVCDPTLKILCVVTQPYDIELMASMVNEVASFVKSNRDWFLLISMHPNENSAFENRYRQVIGNLDRTIISRGNVYHNLNASDAVVTYFSTAGLEAFCLDKPVMAYRSQIYPTVPFDLCGLGVARSFFDSEELAARLGSEKDQLVESEGLQRLKDARSVDRICEFILSKVNVQKYIHGT